jgi:type IV pilus assembly protein PilV
MIATPAKSQQGATLIEVLVAVVVLSIGLLGLAGLQATSVQSNYSAFYRSQATLLAYNLGDRMRANRTAGLASASDASFPASSNSNAVTGTQAQKDKAEWLNNLALQLPDGTGMIEKTGPTLTISVRWTDNRGRIKNAAGDDNGDSTATETFVYRTEI